MPSNYIKNNILNETYKETIGSRIARLRKERGYTQKELAEKMGISWTLISDYERGKLRLHDKILKKLSISLEVTTDELLGLKNNKSKTRKPSLKIMRRLQKIEELPLSKQKALFITIDNFLKAEEK